jgi:hypothetical protein
MPCEKNPADNADPNHRHHYNDPEKNWEHPCFYIFDLRSKLKVLEYLTKLHYSNLLHCVKNFYRRKMALNCWTKLKSINYCGVGFFEPLIWPLKSFFVAKNFLGWIFWKPWGQLTSLWMLHFFGQNLSPIWWRRHSCFSSLPAYRTKVRRLESLGQQENCLDLSWGWVWINDWQLRYSNLIITHYFSDSQLKARCSFTLDGYLGLWCQDTS